MDTKFSLLNGGAKNINGKLDLIQSFSVLVLEVI